MTDTTARTRLALPLAAAALVAGLLLGRATAPAVASSDDRVEKALRDPLARQAEANKAVVDQNREAVAAAARLVQADATARAELVALHRDIQAERAAVLRLQEGADADRR